MRRLALYLCGVAVALLAPAAGLAYSWPLQPFYEPHAVRGYFDDPRLLGATGGAFHFGIDIVADDMTPVYSVEAGRVSARGRTVSVFPKGGGHVLSYWHVIPAVWTGQRVRTHQLIGYVMPGAGHVHFAELADGTYVNPLRIGGIAPYIDDTVPQIPAAMFYSLNRRVRPDLVTGTVDITVDAYDPSPLTLPLEWAQARLAPALIRWRLVQGQNTIRPWQTAVDFRMYLMPAGLIRYIYGPGTFQNKPGRTGRYEFYLAHEFDSEALPNGEYVLQVQALDTQENVGQASFGFTITNPIH